ncbi:uncharacterized protein BKCO1_2400055 [Diplodia corticola]|uniref:Uncharacterized protein n=1 Tax=Diplodia corticola TaxID=236234 RepID=A0A1J9R0U3_9PEZI|nr:uncharacterized protein BKCO1_2400055 [Diplodia corticola]OJD34248.1 hypothetical protein BKCO1_2400055 [Diplodia corticola]
MRTYKSKGKARAQDVPEDPIVTREDKWFDAERTRIEEEDRMLAAMMESRLTVHYARKVGESSKGTVPSYFDLLAVVKNARDKPSGTPANKPATKSPAKMPPATMMPATRPPATRPPPAKPQKRKWTKFIPF